MDRQKLSKLLVVVVLGLGVITGVALMRYRFLAPKADISPVNLVFSPSQITLTPQTSQVVNLVLDPKDQDVIIARIFMEFDKNLLSITGINTSTQVKRIIRKSTLEEMNATGLIQLVLAIDPLDRATPISDPLTLASLTIAPRVEPSGQTAYVTMPGADTKVVSKNAVALVTNSGVLTVNMLSTIPSATPVGGTAPSPTSSVAATGVPNSCNGTCGSNANCANQYYCYMPDPTRRPNDGFCRNPACPESNTCNCPTPTLTPSPRPTFIVIPSQTPSPTLKSTSTPTLRPTLTATSTPKVASAISPTLRVSASPAPTINPQAAKPNILQRFLNWIGRLLGRE